MGHIGTLPTLTELFKYRSFYCQFQIRSIFSKTTTLFQQKCFLLKWHISHKQLIITSALFLYMHSVRNYTSRGRKAFQKGVSYFKFLKLFYL
jgi:hypothetical protein